MHSPHLLVSNLPAQSLSHSNLMHSSNAAPTGHLHRLSRGNDEGSEGSASANFTTTVKLFHNVWKCKSFNEQPCSRVKLWSEMANDGNSKCFCYPWLSRPPGSERHHLVLSANKNGHSNSPLMARGAFSGHWATSSSWEAFVYRCFRRRILPLIVSIKLFDTLNISLIMISTFDLTKIHFILCLSTDWVHTSVKNRALESCGSSSLSSAIRPFTSHSWLALRLSISWMGLPRSNNSVPSAAHADYWHSGLVFSINPSWVFSSF